MALYRRGSSRVWWVDLTDPLGVRHRKSTKTENKQLAEAFEKRFERELYELSMLGKKAERTFKEAVDKLLAERKGKDVAEEYERQLGWWMQQIGPERKLYQIDRQLILETIAIKEREASPATCNRYLAALRACLRLAHKKYEWLDTVPPFFMYEEPKGRTRWLKPDEVMRLLKALPEHLVGPAVVALTTGLRRTVVTGLRWDQVDLVRKVITIEGKRMKNGEDLTIPMPELVMRVVQQQIGKHSERVFTYNGKPFFRCGQRTWDDALAEAGIDDFRWHDMRHTWATMLTQQGVPDAVLMVLGSWKTAKMVKRYAHHNVDSVRAHAAVADEVLSGVTSQILSHGQKNSPEVGLLKVA